MSDKKSLKPNLGLYPKILILMLIISLGPLSAFFFSIYSEIISRIKQDTEILMTETTGALLENIDGWIDTNVRVLRTASKQSSIISMDKEKQTEILKTIQNEYPWIYLVFTIDKDGVNLARSDDEALKNYSDRDYFKEIKSGKNLAWQTLVGKTSLKPALVLALPIFRDGRFTGVIAAAMTTDTISRNVVTWKNGKSGFAFLLDEKNKIIAHPEEKYVLEEKNLSDHPFIKLNKNRTKNFLEFEYANGHRKIGSLKKNDLDWSLILEQEKEEVYKTLSNFERFMYLVFLYTVLIVSIISWLFAKISVTPFLKMTDEAEKREKSLETRLQKVRKMEAIGTFAGGIAHDFNNILGAITTCSEMAIEDVSEENPAHEDLKHILKAAIRGKKLVKQILEYSRSRNTKRKPVKLNKIILECLDLFKIFKPKNIEIKLNIAPKLDYIQADATQLHQVIMNLLLNAENAMSIKSGVLTITLKSIDLSINKINDLPKGEYLHLSVSDTGCGMDDYVIERMFDPFYTTNINNGGTGLGLAMSDVIIKRHKGIITAESELSKGSTFHVFLPCFRVVDPFEEEYELDSEVLNGDERILFVDDDEDMNYSGLKMLRRLGYEVEAQKSSTVALNIFKNNPGKFDLIITDRIMPGKSGVELAHDIREIRPNIPIIMCSGFFNKKDDIFLDIEHDIEGLIDEYVSKPYEIKPMSIIIRRVLDLRNKG
ncbi:MAG: response regulator [Deltaproteobacteria bacterium]|nr:response regulator [Deltaproteobacteria bacterium]